MRLEKFLFCEMARNEVNGQISLIGLFPGDLIIVGLPEDVPFNLLPNLHCVVILGDMRQVRTLRYQCQVRSGGLDIVTTPEQSVDRPELAPYQTLMFGFTPFPCTQGPGDYEFRITVQPQEAAHPTSYTRVFSIQRQNISAPTQH